MDRRPLRYALVAAVTLLISTVAGVSPASAAAGEVYVALGDSAASGPGILPQLTLDPCWRSARNYPHVAADLLGVSTLRDVTCSGAKTDHMTQSQSGVPPQFDALTGDTTLVSLTIGGNDTRLISLGESCVRLNPFERPCYYDNVVNGVDLVNQRIDAYAPKLAATLAGIKQRSPQARVFVVGYGLYVKRNGCWPVQPLLPIDANYVQAKVDYLNTITAREAAAAGATYVDIRTPGAGHDTCQSSSNRWLEGFVPTSVAAPLHPNANGMNAFGHLLADAVN
ncbi:SGNH/GDSL hydrolase family protein [Catelliglobosispora koreensis]|uniref:SGNH/GDSL hydrolase family protein n=1 Tax=Catelliglobosispora koreensis TaxID=129052 RepID=UPI000376848C|nr:SGNH/GDSL hydrolase family protein [Catelliglobosispora koreensis]